MSKVPIKQELESELKKAKPLDGIFYASLIIKGVDGLIEVILALAILFFNPPRVNHLVDLISNEEIFQRHHDFVMGIASHISTAYTDQLRYFLVIYLLIHAGVKLVSVIGLLLNKRWAYPFALISLGILTLYQLYDIIFVKPSLFIILLTIFDVFILWLIWREYKIKYPRKK